jgi:phosphate transport system ATP-binding protein
VADDETTETRVDPVTTDVRSGIDEALKSLDPDAARPECVMESVNLKLGFSGRTVLSDVNVALKRGSITALIGPTGSGKSTFLRTLNRMNDRVPGFSREGDVMLDNVSLWGQNVDLLTLRRRVGMVFQRPNPFPMSIKDNVVAGVKAHRIAKGKQLDVVCERRLTEVGLWDAVKDRLNDSPFRLSGGQQQLLCLARALAVGPEVLLLDEPTSSLDPRDHRVDRRVAQDTCARADSHRRDAQSRPGPAGLAPHDVLLPRAVDGTRTDRRAVHPAQAPRHRAVRHGTDGVGDQPLRVRWLTTRSP